MWIENIRELIDSNEPHLGSKPYTKLHFDKDEVSNDFAEFWEANGYSQEVTVADEVTGEPIHLDATAWFSLDTLDMVEAKLNKKALTAEEIKELL